MNADPFRKLPSEQEYREDLARWPDMHQMPEDEPTNWNPIAVVVFTWAAVLAVVIGWIAAARMF